MIPPSEMPTAIHASRHCTVLGCRKCIARARWTRRKKWRTRKSLVRCNTGRK